MEYWGQGKYRYADGTGNVTKASFISNNVLTSRAFRASNSTTNTNAGGWDGSKLRAFLNGRVYRAFPIEWRALIKPVDINATSGSRSYVITTSQDYVYLQSLFETNLSTSQPFINEIGTGAGGGKISWFVNQTETPEVSAINTAAVQRAKFSRIKREYALPDGATSAYDGEPKLFSGIEDPATTYSLDIAQGSLWRWTSSTSPSNRLLVFLDQDFIDQYGLTPTVESAANGGWISARWWWLRSPYVAGTGSWYNVERNGGSDYSNTSSVGGIVPSFSI